MNDTLPLSLAILGMVILGIWIFTLPERDCWDIQNDCERRLCNGYAHADPYEVQLAKECYAHENETVKA